MPFVQYIRSALVQRVPILSWGRKYDTHKFISDAIAGITVGLTVMPQALAYATLAGLEPQYGLYSAFVGCFVYAVFGSCKDITIGPTALMALMTYQQIVGRNTDYAILLCFLSGIVQLLMAVLHLGVLIDFISIPVTVGFTSATSVIIMTSQLKSLLGLKISSSGFLDTFTKVVQNIHKTRLADCALGVTCIAILMLLRIEMPNQSDILRLCTVLARQKELKVTVNESIKGALITGLGALIGGIIGGPRGLAVGGVSAAVVAAITTFGKYKSVVEIISNEMSEEEKTELAAAVKQVISSTHPSEITDFVTLLATVSANSTLENAVVTEIGNFLNKKLNLQLAQ